MVYISLHDNQGHWKLSITELAPISFSRVLFGRQDIMEDKPTLIALSHIYMTTCIVTVYVMSCNTYVLRNSLNFPSLINLYAFALPLRNMRGCASGHNAHTIHLYCVIGAVLYIVISVLLVWHVLLIMIMYLELHYVLTWFQPVLVSRLATMQPILMLKLRACICTGFYTVYYSW